MHLTFHVDPTIMLLYWVSKVSTTDSARTHSGAQLIRVRRSGHTLTPFTDGERVELPIYDLPIAIRSSVNTIRIILAECRGWE